MSDQQEGNSQEKIAGEGEAIIIEGPTEVLKREDDDRKKRDEQDKQRQLRFNKWLTIFTFCLVVSSVVSDLIYWYQSKTSRIAADAAQESATAATNAARIGGETLVSSQKSFQAEQRPYMVADTVQFVVGPTAPGKTSANITFRNIGRTPAIKIRAQKALLRFHPAKEKNLAGIEKVFTFMQESYQHLVGKLDATAAEKYAEVAREDLAPSDSRFSTAELKEPLLATEMPLVQTGELTLYYIGIIRYTDSYNGSYETMFCYFYFGSDPKVWQICDNHNTIK